MHQLLELIQLVQLVPAAIRHDRRPRKPPKPVPCKQNRAWQVEYLDCATAYIIKHTPSADVCDEAYEVFASKLPVEKIRNLCHVRKYIHYERGRVGSGQRTGRALGQLSVRSPLARAIVYSHTDTHIHEIHRITPRDTHTV